MDRRGWCWRDEGSGIGNNTRRFQGRTKYLLEAKALIIFGILIVLAVVAGNEAGCIIAYDLMFAIRVP